MLRKLLLSSVAITAMVGSAMAADLPRRAPPPRPPMCRRLRSSLGLASISA
jgi:hypothetical protein